MRLPGGACIRTEGNLCLLSHSETLLWRNRSLSSAVIMDCFFFYDECMLVVQFACDFPSCKANNELWRWENEERRLSCFDAIFLCGVFLSRTSKCSRLVSLIIVFRMSRQRASEDLWNKSWSCFPFLFLFEWWLQRFMRKFYSPSLVF